jgi:hypothetical protein
MKRTDATVSSWQALLLAGCAIATLAAFAELFCITGFAGEPPWVGLKGLTEAASAYPYMELISSVGEGWPAANAGLRGGDLADVRQMTVIDRFGIIGQPLSGKKMVLPIQRGAQHFQATVIARPDEGWNALPPDYVGALAAVWLSAFAWLFAVRRSSANDVRLLTLTLICSVLWIVTEKRNVAVPWISGYALIAVVFALSGPIALALWAQFASQFAQPLSPLRRALRNGCFLLGVVSAIVGLGYPLGVLTLWVDPVALGLSPIWTLPHSLQVLSALTCGLVAIASARGEQRQRAGWSIASIALIFCVQPFTQFGQDVTTSWWAFDGFLLAQNAALLVAPLGLTYALLSRRLVDAGFVFNRAAVFSSVSIVVLGTFVLAESLLSDWLRGASHTTNLVATALLALALGLSVRTVHARVDRIVDSIFFRKRHEDESAIRAFAVEAPYVTDETVLLERSIEVLRRHANSSFARILLDDGAGRYGGVSENDPAILRLRATHNVVDLHGVGSSLSGDRAYPMVARGRLVGVLEVGPRLTGEAYAPDESTAIAQLASSVGAALDVFNTNGKTQDGPLTRIETLLQKLASRIELEGGK